MNTRKICVVTGTRAEYGLLYWLMKGIKEDDELELQLVVTGMHLSSEFGNTYRVIENEGFVINDVVEMLLSSDTSVGVSKSIGLATIGFADVFSKLNSDLVIILGDRFEMLAAAQVALINKIPIAHIHGGELTFGSYDDAIRHSITKMATWHFTSSEEHKKRVIQLGESPTQVKNVGALGIENILKLKLLQKKDLYVQLKLLEEKPFLLITYHPETNGEVDGIHMLLSALNKFKDMYLIFTKANSDNGGRLINEIIKEYVKENDSAFLFDSLGQLRYLSAIKYAEVVIGNSSSGIIEAPYLNTPTVNCGNRQGGRSKASSIFDCSLDIFSIQSTISKALEFKGPYEQIFGDGSSSRKILNILRTLPSYSIQKEFYDL
ncbi:UDP-N-acetylglucosamine 2-epimerase [Exiguobacterium undae]